MSTAAPPTPEPGRQQPQWIVPYGGFMTVDGSAERLFVQLTPPGTACSISIGSGLTDRKVTPGSAQGLQLVVADIEQARADLTARGLDVGEVHEFPWGQFLFFDDPDGNGWAVQAFPGR